MIAEDVLLSMPRWVRLRFDPVRGRHVLLAPERVLFPCPTSVHIIERLCEAGGSQTFGTLVDDLAQSFDAPRAVIARDVAAMLEGLVEQRFVDRTAP